VPADWHRQSQSILSICIVVFEPAAPGLHKFQPGAGARGFWLALRDRKPGIEFRSGSTQDKPQVSPVGRQLTLKGVIGAQVAVVVEIDRKLLDDNRQPCRVRVIDPGAFGKCACGNDSVMDGRRP